MKTAYMREDDVTVLPMTAIKPQFPISLWILPRNRCIILTRAAKNA